MSQPKTQGSGNNKIYKPNPKPVPGGIKEAIGWEKDKLGDNRKEVESK